MKLFENNSSALTIAVGAVATVATLYAGKKILPVLLPNEGKHKETLVFDDTQHGGLLVAHVLRNHGVKYVGGVCLLAKCLC